MPNTWLRPFSCWLGCQAGFITWRFTFGRSVDGLQDLQGQFRKVLSGKNLNGCDIWLEGLDDSTWLKKKLLSTNRGSYRRSTQNNFWASTRQVARLALIKWLKHNRQKRWEENLHPNNVDFDFWTRFSHKILIIHKFTLWCCSCEPNKQPSGICCQSNSILQQKSGLVVPFFVCGETSQLALWIYYHNVVT